MAQWFHRNPYKASGVPYFDLGPVATTIPSRMLCSHLAERRKALMTMFQNFNNTRESMIEATNQYISLLMGFATSPDSPDDFDDGDEEIDANSEDEEEKDDEEETPEPGAEDTTEKTKKDKKENKKKEKEKKKAKKAQLSATEQKKVESLRRLIAFTWTDSLDVRHKHPVCLRDANFELICIIFNLALWFSKHAAKLASSPSIEMEEALEVFKSLRNAAALYEYIKKELLPQMKGKVAPGSDLDPNVLEAYRLQSLAEAQEVTIGRAMELNHDPGIIAPLAFETAVLYEKCKFGLQDMPDALVSKWRAYCIFKIACFRAYAHCFYSESELKADRCAMAIASAQEALKYCTQAQNAAKVYRSGSGAEFVFIRRLQPYAQRTLTKAQTENAMIYHQKALPSMPQLQLKASFGIATSEMPAGLNFTVDESWQEAMPGFDTSKVAAWMSQKDYAIKKKESEKLKVIPELPIYQGDKDPNNASGCTIS